MFSGGVTMNKGIAASSGIAIAKAYKLDMPDLTVVKETITDIEKEITRYDSAVADVAKDLERIKAVAMKNLSEEEAAIFDAHALVLADPELKTQVADKIKNESMNADAALREVADMFIGMFESMDDEYFKERAADIRDVSTRLIANLLGKQLPNPALIDKEVVVIADDLTPSDTAQLNKNLVRGFATNIGGRTSHSAILARSMEIPAVVAMNTITEIVNDDDTVILDGMEGIVIVNPTEEQIKEYTAKRDAFVAYKEELKKLKDEESITLDGHHVELVANIGSPKDIDAVNNNGAEGVGLYRTEFLYMESAELPTEEEQFVAYKTVLEGLKGKPVVVRTLDIGGDKKLPALVLPEEMNPFLGVRAIRLCFQEEEIFRTQLRALLRASTYGDLRIMFPMIATLGEFRKAKGILLEEKEKLLAEGIVVSDTLQVGIMIEIPAAAVLADQFAKEVDFFSIGTNDLVQYTFAADRMSTTISYLYQPFNPSILRLVKTVIDAAHAEGKWTGMCGEMAGEAIAAPLLLGLGLDEFSMSATSVLSQRKLIRSMKKSDMHELAEKALNCATMEEVVDLVKAYVDVK
jgi:phosphotransferase system enzyme I (PtsI)